MTDRDDPVLVLGCATSPAVVDHVRATLARFASLAPTRPPERGDPFTGSAAGWTVLLERAEIHHHPDDDRPTLRIIEARRETALVVDTVAARLSGTHWTKAPHPAGADASPAEVVARMETTIALFDRLLALRSGSTAIRSTRPEGDRLLREVEARLRLVGTVLSQSPVDAQAGVPVEAASPWGPLIGGGLLRGGAWAQLVDKDRARRWWTGLPRIARLSLSRARGGTTVTLDGISIDRRGPSGDEDPIATMRALHGLERVR